MRNDDGGQATVEFALVLPVIAFVFMALIQLALIIRSDLLVHDAAREAVRAASLGTDAQAAATRVVPGATVSVERGAVGEPVRVQARLHYEVRIPVVAALFPDVTLRADAEMRAER